MTFPTDTHTHVRTHTTQGPTDEEDGEGDEEQEDVGHQVEGVHEAAVVEHAQRHAVGAVALLAAERQGHAAARLPRKPRGGGQHTTTQHKTATHS